MGFILKYLIYPSRFLSQLPHFAFSFPETVSRFLISIIYKYLQRDDNIMIVRLPLDHLARKKRGILVYMTISLFGSVYSDPDNENDDI